MAKVSLRVYNREIETMIERGHLDEAIANCRHILKTFPKYLETYRLLGKAYLEYKRYPEAVDIFSRLLAAVPDDFVANVGMSIIRDEENKLDDAIWHMERAFETQPSNAAIQGELQRLYGRRDGVQPPRIRMTRGALAHMYVQGELYPQAISEIKSVLNEDGGRVDMQALLARAYYRSGLKNDAADAASSVLRTYPHCLDANRVLMEILSSDRSESAQTYRQRVVELDPYAAHVTGTVFQSNEAPEAAVNLERLDWNGQPVGMQSDWGTTQAISLEEDKSRDEQPDWLKSVFDEPGARSAQTFDSPTIVPHADADQEKPRIVPAFDDSMPRPTSSESAEDIPAFLRDAGWGQSTGAFDESKTAFKYEEPETHPPLAKGELPDWVKAMAPVEAQQPADEEEEELPDWINKLGTGAAPTPSDSGDQPDWMSQLAQPQQAQTESQPSDDQPDWLKQMDPSEQTAPSSDQPDWLKGFSNESDSMPAAPTEQTNWISQLDQPAQSQPESQPSDDQLDWLKQLDQSEQPVPSASDDQPDWLKGFGSEAESAPAASSTEQPDWLGQLGDQSEPVSHEPLATEFDVPAPMEAEPEPFQSASLSSDLDSPVASTEESEQPLPSSPVPSMTDMDNLGTSEQERDDSFAWLENLAARQGASEGLLTKPEERLEEEPDWVKRAKGLSTEQVPASSAPASQPAANLEDLGKSEQERDDSFAWLENLAAKQGASEGLLTRPEDRLEQEPDWVRQARDLGVAAEQPPISPPSPAADVPSSTDDTATWLRSLDEEEPTGAPLFENDATGMWLKSLDEEPVNAHPTQPAEEPEPELPSWMQNIEAEQSAQASAIVSSEEVTAEGSDWKRSSDESTTVQPVQPDEQPESELPAWLQNIEEQKPSESAPVVHEMEAEQPVQRDEIPGWMQNIEAEQAAQASAPSAPAEEAASVASEWMGSTEESAEVPSVQPAEQPESELPAWLQNIEEEKAAPFETVFPASDIAPDTRETEAEQPAQFEATSEWTQNIGEEQSAQPSATATFEKATAEQPEPEIPAWMQNIEEEKASEPESAISAGDIAAGTREIEAEQPPRLDDLPEWMQYIEEKEPAEERTAAMPASDTTTQTVEQTVSEGVSEWMGSIEEPVAQSVDLTEEKPTSEPEEIPAWLSSLEEEEAQITTPTASDEDLPAWLRGEEGAALEPELEPTQAADWQPLEEKQAEPTSPVPEPISEAFEVVQGVPEPAISFLEEEKAATPEPEPHKESAAPIDVAISAMPVDPILGRARDDLSSGNIPGALNTYGRLIRKTRLLDEVIYDLRDALYRFPVDVDIWQALGDAYMRANRLQDALDAYTKAEELLR
ncbi:MAG: tetratricopeptide repeat protein [Anaerolineales bacterium]